MFEKIAGLLRKQEPREIGLPEPGELWELRSDDPFESKYKPVKIIAVKDGWVRYYMGRAFPDERMKASFFVRMYEKKRG